MHIQDKATSLYSSQNCASQQFTWKGPSLIHLDRSHSSLLFFHELKDELSNSMCGKGISKFLRFANS
jgi:hypothetical protein